MNGIVLTLGPVIFQDFEIPATITFGGRQRLAIRYLTTGERVTDVLGPDDATISFTGILSGPTASTRAREIDTLRTIGQPQTIAWGAFTYTVVIANFESEFENEGWIPYKIHCVILQNQNILPILRSLSSAAEALASLELMYTTVPSALLSMTDPRNAIAAYNARGIANGGADLAMTLQNSAETLATEQHRQELVLVSMLPSGTTSPHAFIEGFNAAVGLVSNLQYLALSRDCLGQAAVYLENEHGP